MQHRFIEHIASRFPELLEQHFILACSGGVDSMVLTHLCSVCKLDFSLAHCNFGLRANDSDKDESFVRDSAKKYNREFYVTYFDTIGYVDKKKVSVQMAARELRYRWFAEVMKKKDIGILVTAHHADDNLETFLINLSRGTGIDGLTGIPEKTATMYRPLLCFSRDEILTYAKAEKLEWREDSSNADTKYLRNRIRHGILPLLKELHPTFSNNFGSTLNYLSGAAKIIENHIGQIRNDLFDEVDNVIKIRISELEKLKPTKAYVYQLFNVYGFTAWDDIYDLLTAISGKEVVSGTHRLVKNREFLLLEKRNAETSATYAIKNGQAEIGHPVRLKITTVNSINEKGKNILYVDKAALKFPLTVRKWEKGDYFYPFGMKGKKRLSKFFKDERIDVISKGKQWLLCSKEDIVWVIGKRPDDRFKVTKETKEIIKIIVW